MFLCVSVLSAFTLSFQEVKEMIYNLLRLITK
jgi:hypothetical protein